MRQQDSGRRHWVLFAVTSGLCWNGGQGGAQPGVPETPPRLLPRICEGCLQEPLEVDYFGGTVGGDPPRFRSLSRDAFEELALWGRVAIIENASFGTAMGGWTCERISKEFPDARMRREYDWVANPSDRNLQKMGTKKWTETKEPGEDQEERLRQDPNVPPYAPFYWGVREHARGDAGPRETLKKVKDLIAKSVPSFMEQEVNGQAMFDNAEFWMGAQGTGARAHMDSHCISTLSVVLSGERRWRVGPVPRMPLGGGRSRRGDVVFDDGVAYELGWQPMFEFTARAGEAVLFPPGWIHETLNTGEGCTVALTTQFTNPLPIKYWRSYYQRLRRIGDLNPCWDQMLQWASLRQGRRLEEKIGSEDKWRTKAEGLYNRHVQPDAEPQASKGAPPVGWEKFYDVDSDGMITQEEFVNTYIEWAKTEQVLQQERQVSRPRPDMSLEEPLESASGRSTEL